MSDSGVGVAPSRPRNVPNHSNLWAIRTVTGASRPKAVIAGLQIAPAQLSVAARPRCRDCWRSASMPATQAPDCQLKPVWPPKVMPLSLADVLVAIRVVAIEASLKAVSVLDLPQP